MNLSIGMGEHVVVGKHAGVRASLVFFTSSEHGEDSARQVMQSIALKLAGIERVHRKVSVADIVSAHLA